LNGTDLFWRGVAGEAALGRGGKKEGKNGWIPRLRERRTTEVNLGFFQLLQKKNWGEGLRGTTNIEGDVLGGTKEKGKGKLTRKIPPK